VPGSRIQRGLPRRCSSMPRCATGARGSSRTGSAAAANAWCADGQEIPACRAAPAGVMPRSRTSYPACSSSRRVIFHRGGDPVNVIRGHSPFSHAQRRLTRHTSASPAPWRTSRGRAVRDSHTSGSWDPRPRTQRNDTPRNATTRSQSAGRRHPGIGQTFISRVVTSRIPAFGSRRRPGLHRREAPGTAGDRASCA